MTYEYSRREKHIEATFKGELSASKNAGFIRTIKKIWTENGKLPMLLNVSEFELSSNTIDDYNIAKAMEAAAFYELKRIAVLDRLSRKAQNDFLETAASNRGVYIKFFYSNKVGAIEWILM